MAEVKWVKITTDMFDNRKIKHLRRLPDGNNIVLIWVMLLTMAGRCNAGGMVFLTENIPYTSKMLADELGFEENTVILALDALKRLNMIVTDEGFFTIAGWEEYQNVEGMDKIREQNRLRQKKWYDKQKALPNVSPNVIVTRPNAIEEDIDTELDLELDKDSKKKKDKLPKHKYGEYNNVLLTDAELDKLKTDYPDWQVRIERLSGYIAQSGKKYSSHYATIRNWARKDAQSPTQAKQSYKKPSKADELNDFYGMAAEWAESE